MRAEARKQMAMMNEKAMLALNLPQLSPVGETLFQLKTEPQLSPTNYSRVSERSPWSVDAAPCRWRRKRGKRGSGGLYRYLR